MKPTTKRPAKSPPKVRAKRMYLGTLGQLFPNNNKEGKLFSWHKPVFVLPATPEGYDVMVEQMAKKMWAKRQYKWPMMTDEENRQGWRHLARMALAGLGIVDPIYKASLILNRPKKRKSK